MNNNFSVKKITFYLAPLVLALSVAMDVYVPAIPKLTHFFSVSDNKMLLTLNIFMLTAGFMQLVIGPLSDNFGRKKIAYIMNILFALGCILCALANTIWFLIFGRIIQSIGSAGLMVIGFTIVRDCFVGNKSAAVYSYLNGVISFSPMFATFLGSYIDIYFGWRMTFLVLLIIALVAWFSLYFFLPETLPYNKRVNFNPRYSLRQYKIIFVHPVFALYNLATCFGLAYLYLFCALSPYLIIRNLQIPEYQYGFYFFYMGFSFFIGSLLCSQIVERLGVYNTCMIGFIISLIGGLWIACWHLLSGLTLHGFIYPMLLVGIGGTFGMGAGIGGAMTPFSNNIGIAAALGGTLRFMFSSLAGMLVIHDDVASTLPLGVPAILFSLLGIGLFTVYKKKLTSIHAEEEASSLPVL